MTVTETKKLKITITAAFFLFIVAFGLFRSADLIFGVKIRGIAIENGSTLTESVMEVSGNAKNAVNLTLNGREIPVDLEGNFRETIALLPGYNIVNVRATDKFGYTDEKNYQLLLARH